MRFDLLGLFTPSLSTLALYKLVLLCGLYFMPLAFPMFSTLAFSQENIGQENVDQEKKGGDLVLYEVVDVIQSKSIPKSLTDGGGDINAGEELIVAREKGNCIACHIISAFDEKAKKAPNKYGDMGEIGPPLDGVAERYSEGQLRLILVDAKQIFPDTIMPSFYRVKDLHRVGGAFDNKPILQAQEVEDILSFLMTLR